MRHRKKLSKLNRPSDQRLSLLNTLAKQLITHGQIVTTQARAKALAPYVDGMINKAIKGEVKDLRTINTRLNDRRVVYLLKHEIVPKLTRKSDGGYTRIVKMPPRRGDGSFQAMVAIMYEQAD
ncbi:50S ribosomal protein L17 [bacterium]|nr:50S ribosomal protein L17 [bacterium]MBU1025741.1 50S ribosomal protein L17 [bacterium]